MNILAYYTLLLLLILSFNIGLLSILGVSETITRLSIDSLMLVLIVIASVNILINKKIIFPMLIVFLTLLFVTLFSYLNSELEGIDLIIFFRKVLIYFFFYYALLNINLQEKQLPHIIKLIIYLFLIQILATIVKLLTVGVMEPYIGTIGVIGGSLATIVPLMAASYIFSVYLIDKNTKILYYLPLFIMIGLASSKIAVIIYLFMLFLFLLLLYSYKKDGDIINIKIIFKYIIYSLLFLGILSASFISLNPRLNPEGKVGGSIDIKYLDHYIDMYNNADLLSYARSTGIKGQGRGDAHAAVYNLLSKKDTGSLLLGMGPGDIVMSSHMALKDPLRDKYKIGYGGRIGYLWIAVQIGYMGTFLFALFHLLLLRTVANIYPYKQDKEIYKYVLTLFGFSMIFFLDYLTYSSTFLLDPAPILVYLFAFYYVQKILYIKKENNV